MNKFVAAESLGKQAITIADSFGQPFTIYQVYSITGFILEQQKKYAEAIPCLERSIAISEKTNQYNEPIGAAYFILSTCYEQTGELY